MPGQINASICTGMGAEGKQRLRRYKKAAGIRGFSTFSAYVVHLLDKEVEKISSGKVWVSERTTKFRVREGLTRGDETKSNGHKYFARNGHRGTGTPRSLQEAGKSKGL